MSLSFALLLEGIGARSILRTEDFVTIPMPLCYDQDLPMRFGEAFSSEQVQTLQGGQ